MHLILKDAQNFKNVCHLPLCSGFDLVAIQSEIAANTSAGLGGALVVVFVIICNYSSLYWDCVTIMTDITIHGP